MGPTCASCGAENAPSSRFFVATEARREGLLSLLQGDADGAVELLTAAVDAEHDFGIVFDAACLELGLARALEARGDRAAAEQVRARASAVLEPLGCVHPF